MDKENKEAHKAGWPMDGAVETYVRRYGTRMLYTVEHIVYGDMSDSHVASIRTCLSFLRQNVQFFGPF